MTTTPEREAETIEAIRALRDRIAELRAATVAWLRAEAHRRKPND